ncbi:DUF4358 domain-containing protein [Anaeromicrobium sediminis]|uniref:DUF4358 domain-containing protein n=1 Tax=Anaeromicrobium sediminis TaxID=1478221 RepID=A0A267MQT0_9FIRM|nr:DUF4358 domain-containing protein [Anaeromicrobium sediminis]PAB61090.1 hypothetical protein CCE28_01285 [Anaeromicrobium sediminis]
MKKILGGVMMKKILSLLVVFITLFSFVGCSEKVPNIAMKDIMTNIENESQIVSGLTELDLKKADLNDYEKQIIESLDLNTDDIEEGIMKFPMINLQADSVILLKAKDSSKLPELKVSLEKYVENQIKAFENYLPQNLDVVKNHILKEKGNYIILIVSHEADKIELAFDNSFNTSK